MLNCSTRNMPGGALKTRSRDTSQRIEQARTSVLVSRNNFASRKIRYMVKLNERKIRWIIHEKLRGRGAGEIVRLPCPAPLRVQFVFWDPIPEDASAV